MTARRDGRLWIDAMSCFLPGCEISLLPRAKWAAPPLGVKRPAGEDRYA
jgi:hypothetical protein